MAVAAVLVVARQRTPAAPDESPLPAPRDASAAIAVRQGDFVGSPACAPCHQAQFAAWSRSTHAAAGGAPNRQRIIAPFNGESIRFADAVVIPQQLGNSWQFAVRQQGRPEVLIKVDGVVGGGHMEGGGTQGFVTRHLDGTVRFLPFDFSRAQNTWFCNTGTRANNGWVPITPALRLADCGDWPPTRVLGDESRFANCQSCHGSQIAVTSDTSAHTYRTTYTSLDINCESCHGPGRAHLGLVRDTAAIARGEIGMIPLAALSKDKSLGVCFQCHALKDQLAPGFLSGSALLASYSLHYPQLGDAAHWPDGRVRTFAYQQGHLFSDCYINGGMTCTSCHDPHSQGYRDAQGAPLANRVDDRQCTACHAAKAQNPGQHSHHPPNSAASRCVACHMPYLQEPEVGPQIRYARSDHSIAIPRPRADSALGITSACKACHADKSESRLDEHVRAWYGDLKPQSAAVASVVAGTHAVTASDAARQLLPPDSPHTAALFAGLASFVDSHVRPGEPLQPEATSRLLALARHPDIDIRALALATLHATDGKSRDVRPTLRAALADSTIDEIPLRRRWATALGYLADKQRTSGASDAAVATYGLAIDIEPANPRSYLNRGLALVDAGRVAEGIAAYQKSLALDPVQPLAWVNLGIALARRDRAQAIAAYKRALNINSNEPLAHFNLGNLYLEANELDQAAESYRRALRADPALALANFYLARIAAQRGQLQQALALIDAGLEFDRSNAEALNARSQIAQLIASGRR